MENKISRKEWEQIKLRVGAAVHEQIKADEREVPCASCNEFTRPKCQADNRCFCIMRNEKGKE